MIGTSGDRSRDNLDNLPVPEAANRVRRMLAWFTVLSLLLLPAVQVAFGSEHGGGSDGDEPVLVVTRNDDLVQELTRRWPGGEVVVLRLELRAEPGAAGFAMSVEYRRGDAVELDAVARVDAAGVVVTGTSMGWPFSHRLEALGDDLYRASWRLGEDVTLEIGPLHPGETPAGAEDFRDYGDVVAASAADVPVRRIESMLGTLPADQRTRLDGILGIVLQGVDGRAHLQGIIGKYLQCLEEGCHDCSGCWEWNGPCHGCPQDSLWAQLGAFACYQVVAETCWFEWIKPILPMLGGLAGAK